MDTSIACKGCRQKGKWHPPTLQLSYLIVAVQHTPHHRLNVGNIRGYYVEYCESYKTL